MKPSAFLTTVFTRATSIASVLAMAVAGPLAGCAMSERNPGAMQYDFGDRPLALAVAPSGSSLPSVAARVQASTALDGTDMLYRLAYSDATQLRAYTLARWAMPPAELVQQRLREGLSQQRAVLKSGEGAQLVMQIDLDEFSQVFDAPGQSSGLLRLRATVLKATPVGYSLLAQRSVRMQRPASGDGAAAGVRALSAATDAAVDELVQWLQTLR
jgi:cholesterol transport system auxiliary component